MKKKYIKPQSWVIRINPQTLLANSNPSVTVDPTATTSQHLSRDNNDSWSSPSQEEDNSDPWTATTW